MRGAIGANDQARIEATSPAQTRRDDLQHGTNAACVQGCISSECRPHQRMRTATHQATLEAVPGRDGAHKWRTRVSIGTAPI
jgi:hypothetical protein